MPYNKKKPSGWNALSDKDKLGIKIILGVVATLVAFVALLFSLKSKQQEYDAVSLCPAVPPSHTIILIDRSDGPATSQAEQMETIVQRMKEDLQPLEQLSIYSIANQPSPSRHFSKCNPGSGSQANALYENPVLIQQKFDRQFGNGFDTAFEGIKNIGELPKSYIMESIRVLGSHTSFESKVKKRKLVIFSDMQQNSDLYSIVRQIPDFQDFVDRQTNLASLDMSGIQVEIYLLMRRKNTSEIYTNRLVEFWQQYFQKQGVYDLSFRKIF